MFERLELFYIDNKPAYAYLPWEFAVRNNITTAYSGPRNIKWKKEVIFKEPLEYLSEGTRKKIMKARKHADNELLYSFEFSQNINQNEFAEWLELYNKNIEKKELGIPKIDMKWFEKAKETNKFGSIFIKNSERRIIAGAIIGIDRFREEISCDYRAHEYIRIKDSSLSALLEMCIDEFALEMKAKTIVRGTDENLYGIRLGLGLMEFKEYYGFKAYPMDYNNTYYKRALIFFNKFNKVVTFGYDQDGNLTKNIIEETQITPFNSVLEYR